MRSLRNVIYLLRHVHLLLQTALRIRRSKRKEGDAGAHPANVTTRKRNPCADDYEEEIAWWQEQR